MKQDTKRTALKTVLSAGTGRLLAGIALLLLGGCVAQPVDQQWREIRTENFNVISNTGERAAVDLAMDLERFRAMAIKITGITPHQQGIPTKVFLFGDFLTYDRLVKTPGVVGYMWPTLRANYIVVGPGPYFVDQRRVVFHEYVHFLLRNQKERIYPAWYDEGLAQVLSHVRIRREHVDIGAVSRDEIERAPRSGGVFAPVLVPVVGRPDGFRAGQSPVGLMQVAAPVSVLRPTDVSSDEANTEPVYAMARQWEMPIDELAGTDDVSGLPFNERVRFYAQAWALTHVLSVGHGAGLPDRNPDLQRYFDLLNEGATRTSAFAEAFDFDQAQIEEEVKVYLGRRRLPGFRLDRDEIEFSRDSRHRVLGTSEAARELGSLMLLYGSRRSDITHTLFEHAVTTDPGDGQSVTGLATAMSLEGRLPEAIAAAREAVASDPDNLHVRLDMGNLLLRSCAFSREYRSEACQETLREAQGEYARALELAPEVAEAHAGYGVALSRLGSAPQQAIHHLTVARDKSRWLPQLHMELGRLYLRQSEWDEAADSLQQVVRWSRNPDLKRTAARWLAELDKHLAMTEDASTPGG